MLYLSPPLGNGWLAGSPSFLLSFGVQGFHGWDRSFLSHIFTCVDGKHIGAGSAPRVTGLIALGQYIRRAPQTRKVQEGERVGHDARSSRLVRHGPRLARAQGRGRRAARLAGQIGRRGYISNKTLFSFFPNQLSLIKFK